MFFHVRGEPQRNVLNSVMSPQPRPRGVIQSSSPQPSLSSARKPVACTLSSPPICVRALNAHSAPTPLPPTPPKPPSQVPLRIDVTCGKATSMPVPGQDTLKRILGSCRSTGFSESSTLTASGQEFSPSEGASASVPTSPSTTPRSVSVCVSPIVRPRTPPPGPRPLERPRLLPRPWPRSRSPRDPQVTATPPQPVRFTGWTSPSTLSPLAISTPPSPSASSKALPLASSPRTSTLTPKRLPPGQSQWSAPAVTSSSSRPVTPNSALRGRLLPESTPSPSRFSPWVLSPNSAQTSLRAKTPPPSPSTMQPPLLPLTAFPPMRSPQGESPHRPMSEPPRYGSATEAPRAPPAATSTSREFGGLLTAHLRASPQIRVLNDSPVSRSPAFGSPHHQTRQGSPSVVRVVPTVTPSAIPVTRSRPQDYPVKPDMGISKSGAMADAAKWGALDARSSAMLGKTVPHRFAALDRMRGNVLPPEDGGFVDVDFPPAVSSLGMPGRPHECFEAVAAAVEQHGVVWRRGSEFASMLFNKTHPNDIMQGLVGNCQVLAGIAALGEFPLRIQEAFAEKELNPSGRYNVRLFDVCAKQWRWVTIDDYIPHVHQDGEIRPLGVQPRDSELWVLLLEKACAKWFGGYARLNSRPALLMLMVLGECELCKCFAQPYAMLTPSLGSRERDVIAYNTGIWEVRQAAMVDARCTESYQEIFMGQTFSPLLFDELKAGDLSNAVMMAWTFKEPPVNCIRGYGPRGEAISKDGIVMGQCYSLIGVLSVEADGRLWQIIQIRNPWGADPLTQWSGPLSDTWAGWSRHPELAMQLSIKDWDWLDGMFFMLWEDFLLRFSHAGIAYVTCTRGLEKYGKQELQHARFLTPWAATERTQSPASRSIPSAAVLADDAAVVRSTDSMLTPLRTNSLAKFGFSVSSGTILPCSTGTCPLEVSPSSGSDPNVPISSGDVGPAYRVPTFDTTSVPGARNVGSPLGNRIQTPPGSPTLADIGGWGITLHVEEQVRTPMTPVTPSILDNLATSPGHSASLPASAGFPVCGLNSANADVRQCAQPPPSVALAYGGGVPTVRPFTPVTASSIEAWTPSPYPPTSAVGGFCSSGSLGFASPQPVQRPALGCIAGSPRTPLTPSIRDPESPPHQTPVAAFGSSSDSRGTPETLVVPIRYGTPSTPVTSSISASQSSVPRAPPASLESSPAQTNRTVNLQGLESSPPGTLRNVTPQGLESSPTRSAGVTQGCVHEDWAAWTPPLPTLVQSPMPMSQPSAWLGSGSPPRMPRDDGPLAVGSPERASAMPTSSSTRSDSTPPSAPRTAEGVSPPSASSNSSGAITASPPSATVVAAATAAAAAAAAAAASLNPPRVGGAWDVSPTLVDTSSLSSHGVGQPVYEPAASPATTASSGNGVTLHRGPRGEVPSSAALVARFSSPVPGLGPVTSMSLATTENGELPETARVHTSDSVPQSLPSTTDGRNIIGSRLDNDQEVVSVIKEWDKGNTSEDLSVGSATRERWIPVGKAHLSPGTLTPSTAEVMSKEAQVRTVSQPSVAGNHAAVADSGDIVARDYSLAGTRGASSNGTPRKQRPPKQSSKNALQAGEKLWTLGGSLSASRPAASIAQSKTGLTSRHNSVPASSADQSLPVQRPETDDDLPQTSPYVSDGGSAENIPSTTTVEPEVGLITPAKTLSARRRSWRWSASPLGIAFNSLPPHKRLFASALPPKPAHPPPVMEALPPNLSTLKSPRVNELVTELISKEGRQSMLDEVAFALLGLRAQ
eukprot:TRINITY_DN23914_c0_g1_i1.p1 TRINITY_DN23914_c0_g1~~TRINITY_DN23914_c0_g1_i1.p1  ORF type:complete len:1763 (+),score=213.49 TRINITY_DN23914_c0_g1_i1:143-5431(+)